MGVQFRLNPIVNYNKHDTGRGGTCPWCPPASATYDCNNITIIVIILTQFCIIVCALALYGMLPVVLYVMHRGKSLPYLNIFSSFDIISRDQVMINTTGAGGFLQDLCACFTWFHYYACRLHYVHLQNLQNYSNRISSINIEEQSTALFPLTPIVS